MFYRDYVITLTALLLFWSGTVTAHSLSSGCGLKVPEKVTAEVEIDGIQRPFIMVLPEEYTADQAYDLVLAFHGRTDTNDKVRSYFRLEAAARNPTIFVYPSGTRDKKEHNHWWRSHDPANKLRDYELFDKVLALIENNYCIDTDKVYLFGHSLGATFVNSLGCARADKVRAIVTVAGGILHAKCSGPVTAMILHNPKDELVKIADGIAARNWLLKNNGFENKSVKTEPESLNCRRYGEETSPEPILWCEHHHDYNNSKRFYPHNWPAETATEAFNFFSRLPAER